SAQMAELYAVYRALLQISTPLNIFSDSKYIVSSLQFLETVPLIMSKVTFIQQHFGLIQSLLYQRQHPLFIGHIRSHSNLPGPLSRGNSKADYLTRILTFNVTKARHLHDLHHLPASSLQRLCRISREQARAIVRDCSSCLSMLPVPRHGINPHGLLPNDLWQMDVTHYPPFGKLSYLHVTIDTFSHFAVVTALSGERTAHVITHLLHCFSILGIPKTIKTDNGPSYISAQFSAFCTQFSIVHKTGIPYNPQGQGIVERFNLSLKQQL
ncbi:hypothetical protein N326_11173, partial [Eurypyga helias]